MGAAGARPSPCAFAAFMAVANELETPRLRLRAYTREDLDLLAALYADPDVTAFTKLGSLTRAEAAATLDGYLTDWRVGVFGMCAVFLKAGGEFAGECGFFVLERTGELALRYALHKRFWGQGLASEAAQGVIDHAFRRLGLARIVSFVEARNEASHRVMQKLGFTVERIERLPKVELHVYAVTADEWLGGKP
jgi:ribosomal-protein-alanine N-acetyltransferase